MPHMDDPFDILGPVPLDHAADGYDAVKTGWNARPAHDARADAVEMAEECMAAADTLLDRYQHDTAAYRDDRDPLMLPDDHPWNSHTVFHERFRAYAVAFAEAADRMQHQHRELVPYNDVRTEEACLSEYAEALERQSELATGRAGRAGTG